VRCLTGDDPDAGARGVCHGMAKQGRIATGGVPHCVGVEAAMPGSGIPTPVRRSPSRSYGMEEGTPSISRNASFAIIGEPADFRFSAQPRGKAIHRLPDRRPGEQLVSFRPLKSRRGRGER
jgi:hypothetical protein